MKLTPKQLFIKLISLIPAMVLGIFFNNFLTSTYAINWVGPGFLRAIIILIGQVLVFYIILQLLFFRGKCWTRAELLIALIIYFAVLLVGLVFRYEIRAFPDDFEVRQILNHVELNPLSFIADFLADRDSIVIAVINLVLFIPLPVLMSRNGMKPRFRVALILFFGIELLQLLLSTGFFSLGDIVLYSAGFFLGLFFLKKAFRESISAKSSEASEEAKTSSY